MDSSGRQPGLAVAGLAGGLLTVLNPIPFALWAPQAQGLDGVWLGLTLAAYFRIVSRDRSTVRAVSIALLSVGAYSVALLAGMAAAFGAMMTTSAALAFDAPNDLPGVAMFAGGVVGAIVLSAGTFVLYTDQPRRAVPAILACGIAGGALGVAASYLDQVMRPPGQPFTMSVVFVTWQTGIALVMGLLWPEARNAAAPGAPSAAVRR